VAECDAIQLANRTAVELGASVGYAAALVREGGVLDLGHADSIWQ
jgi:hypothetical protein